MALTCARCGTQNPDGNSFCQACGTPLAAVAPRPPMGPPPDLPPPTYQSPYYAPVPGVYQPPIHRTPWVLIISAVLGLLVIMAGGGAALAFVNARNNQTSADVLPSPSPAGTPSPIPTASPITGGA